MKWFYWPLGALLIASIGLFYVRADATCEQYLVTHWADGSVMSETKINCENEPRLALFSSPNNPRTHVFTNQEKPLSDALLELFPQSEIMAIDIVSGRVRVHVNPLSELKTEPRKWIFPLIYGFGFASGVAPDTLVKNLPQHGIGYAGWSFVPLPERYLTGDSVQVVADALKENDLIVPIRIARFMGKKVLSERLRRIGLRSAHVTPPSPNSHTHNKGKTTWKAVVQAYATIARSGIWGQLCWSVHCDSLAGAPNENHLTSQRHGVSLPSHAAVLVADLLFKKECDCSLFEADFGSENALIAWRNGQLIALRGDFDSSQMATVMDVLHGKRMHKNDEIPVIEQLEAGRVTLKSPTPSKQTRLINEDAYHREYRLSKSKTALFSSHIAVDWIVNGVYQNHGKSFTYQLSAGANTVRAEAGAEHDVFHFVVFE